MCCGEGKERGTLQSERGAEKGGWGTCCTTKTTRVFSGIETRARYTNNNMTLEVFSQKTTTASPNLYDLPSDSDKRVSANYHDRLAFLGAAERSSLLGDLPE